MDVAPEHTRDLADHCSAPSRPLCCAGDTRPIIQSLSHVCRSTFRRAAFDVRRATFGVLRSTCAVRRTTFGVLRAAFDVIRSRLDARRAAFHVPRAADARRGAFDVRRLRPACFVLRNTQHQPRSRRCPRDAYRGSLHLHCFGTHCRRRHGAFVASLLDAGLGLRCRILDRVF